MLGKTHRVGGLCTGVIMSSILMNSSIVTDFSSERFILSSALVCGSVFGSLLPDIDHPDSTLGRKVKPLSLCIDKIFGHRGLFHSPLLYIVLTGLLLIFTKSFHGFSQYIYISFIFGIGAGTLNHLLLDALTVSGIPLLLPFSKKRFRLAKIKTGTKWELIVSAICIFIMVLFLWLM